MKRFVRIEGGIVAEAIERNDDFEPAEAYHPSLTWIESATGEIGDLWNGSEFSKPVAPVPSVTAPATVSMRQARLALLGAGLLQPVNDAIAAMPGTEGEAARIEWEYATEVRRDSRLVAGMAGALTLTEQQLDDLFLVAAGL